MKYVKGLAYGGALSGIAISLWANIRDAYIPEIPPHVDPELWRPGYPGYHATNPGWFDIAIAVFFPLALGVAIELLMHVDWTSGFKDKVTRWGGVGAVGAIAGVVSYWHLRTALLLNGQNMYIASFAPIAVDGFAFMCVQVLLKIAEQEHARPPAPNLVPPPPMVLPEQPLPLVPHRIPQDQPHAHPWTSPPGTPLTESAAPRDTVPDVPRQDTPEQGDKPQATALVPPTAPPSAGGEHQGAHDQPAPQDTDTPLPGQSGERGPLDTPEGSSDREGSTAPADRGSAGLDPTDLEVWAHFRNGKTKAELAAMYSCHEKTIQRRLKKVREATAAEEEHTNA